MNKDNSRPARIPAPDLKDFPDNDMLINYWQLGLEEAQDLFRSLGIIPANNNVHETANDWFFKPHKLESTTDNGMLDKCNKCGLIMIIWVLLQDSKQQKGEMWR